ncbi:hypothetical protein J8281_11840 [Aquimarina sp. U1-2]|uniref:amylo-alpha-1,6-glucosidase n=1 Tax=Aquimarina sp. U1-2 TaxID=2823141 RepID=UPI001AEC96E9|nr:trehalase family glycosidase [Aquimarina sp. U1-2]MBP2832877.1 hypothetical protein [Aquimarina sp. U1-2]
MFLKLGILQKSLILIFLCSYYLICGQEKQISFSLKTVPFSQPGSFYTIKEVHNEPGTLEITTAKRSAVTYRWDPDKAWSNNIFKLRLIRDGESVSYQITVSPWELVLKPKSGKGQVKITLTNKEDFLFQIQDIEVVLESYRSLKGVHQRSEKEAGFVPHFSKTTAQLKIFGQGAISIQNKSFVMQDNAKVAVLRLSDFPKPWEAKAPNYQETIAQIKKEWRNWMSKAPKVPEELEESRDIAWYIMRNMIVGPYNNYSRQAILMSKMGMNQIWAWDNCINAVSVAKANPKLAWDQIQIFFDKQTETGMIPDPINDYTNQYGFTKPPIQGWAILKMIEIQGEQKALPFVKEVYDPMRQYINWWFTFRDINGNSLLEYFDGVDSGWDNATVFDKGCPIEGPDLAAHMIIQFQAMAKMAKMLKKPEEATQWKEKQKSHLKLLLNRFLNKNNRFEYPKIEESLAQTEKNKSLIRYIPIELGSTLPKDIIDALAEDLLPGGDYMTNYGLASESPKSAHYESDGYWRGPIWAPSTLLIFDGLVKAGKKEQAKEIAIRFCNMVAKDNGFYENYDALTGEGLRDKGYTWTAASFLIMAEWLAKNQ